MTDPTIGHNSGASLYVSDIGKLQAIDAVLRNPRFSQTEALVLIGLIVRSDKGYANAFPGASTLAVYAKVAKRDAVFKALRNLEDHFKVITRESRGSGRSNTYAVIPQRVVDAIVEEYDRKKAATRPSQGDAPPVPINGTGLEPDPSSQEGRLSGGRPSEGDAGRPAKGDTYPFLDPDSPPKGKSADEEPANKFVPFNWKMLNQNQVEDAHDIGWNAAGMLEVRNGFKVELETIFPNVDLMSGLAIVSGEAMPHEGPTDLKKRIRRKFGYLNNEEKNKDARYAKAASKKKETVEPSKTESRRERLQKVVAATLEKPR